MVKMSTVWDRTAEFLTDNLSAVVPIALFAYFVPFSITGNFEQTSAGATWELKLVFQLVSLAFAVLATWGSLTLAAMVIFGDGRSSGAIGGRRLLPALVVKIVLFHRMRLAVRPGDRRAGDERSRFRGAPGRRQARFHAGHGGDRRHQRAARAAAAAVAFGAAGAGRSGDRRRRRDAGRDRALVAADARARVADRRGADPLWHRVGRRGAVAKFVFGSIFQLIAGRADGLSLSGVLTSIAVAAVQTAVAVIGPLFTANLLLAVAPEPATAS
ncbi:MAG: hypothetical protein WDN24_00465 [Sphingomonas sp.]